jgi:hypothetical protein
MQSIDLSIAVDRPIREAQAQVLGLVDPLLHAGYTSRRAGDTVEYRPKFIGLPIMWAIRRLMGGSVRFTFEQQGSATQVRANGRLRNRPYAELTEALGGS